MKTKVLLSVGVLAAVFALSLCAAAGPIDPNAVTVAPGPGDPITEEVVFLGETFCINTPYCPEFASWGGTAGGFVEFLGPDGQPAEYIWTNRDGTLTFESLPLNVPPPSYDPLLGILHESDMLQEVDQFFPGGVTRPLFVLSSPSVPEPSTFLLFGSAGVMMFGRIRRFLRP
jgi:PEP-CTERM motif